MDIRRVASPIAALLAVVGPLLVLAPVRGAVRTPVTINVPADRPTIAAAMSAAQDGDTVLVASGTYRENLDFAGKAITVTSAQGPTATIIDGGGVAQVVSFHGGETAAAVLRGFTLEHGAGTAATRDGGGGILVTGASPTITGNVITANAACGGAGMAVTGGAPLIRGNTVTQNTARDSTCTAGGGAGILLVGSDAQVIGNTITDNTWAQGGGGLSVSGGAPLILDNVISGNSGPQGWSGGGGIALGGPVDAIIAQNLITSNHTSRGGGIEIDLGGGLYGGSAGHSLLVNNTFVGNEGETVYIMGSSPQPALELDSNIVVAVPGQPAFACDSSYPPTSPLFLHNDSFTEGPPANQGCVLGPPANGNIALDPQFVDAVHGNYHLAATSPSADSGDATAPYLAVTDLDGGPRVQGAAVDQGVYEFAGTGHHVPRAATTVHVPGDQPTIAAAITAANDGDTVLVAPGTYRENLDFGGKTITVESAQGPASTIIDGGNLAPVVNFQSGEPRAAVLRGFTLEHGNTALNGMADGGGGVHINLASPTILANVITQNGSCGAGAGVGVGAGAPLIEGNTITGNGRGRCTGGGGIAAGGAGTQIVGNTVAGNTGDGSGITLTGSGPILVETNVISGNRTSGSEPGGGLLVQAVQAAIVENLITGNVASGSGGVEASAGGQGSSLVFVNNTIAANKAAGLYLGAYAGAHIELDGNIVDGSGSHQQAIVCAVVDPSAQIILTGNDGFAGKASGFAGCPSQAAVTGNISATPRLVNATGGDYHLAAGSPAVDAGNPAAPLIPSTDLDGGPRVQGSAIDMGAYETVAAMHPDAVGSLTAAWSKKGTIIVTWTAPPSGGGAPLISYQVALAPGGTTKTVKAKTTSAKFSHLSPSTAYTVTVAAVNSAGAGPRSTVAVPAAA